MLIKHKCTYIKLSENENSLLSCHIPMIQIKICSRDDFHFISLFPSSDVCCNDGSHFLDNTNELERRPTVYTFTKALDTTYWFVTLLWIIYFLNILKCSCFVPISPLLTRTWYMHIQWNDTCTHPVPLLYLIFGIFEYIFKPKLMVFIVIGK